MKDTVEEDLLGTEVPRLQQRYLTYWVLTVNTIQKVYGGYVPLHIAVPRHIVAVQSALAKAVPHFPIYLAAAGDPITLYSVLSRPDGTR